MADQKITQLTELSVQPASTDVLPIVDIDDTTMAGSGTTKRISVTNLLASKADSTHTHAIGDITGTVPTSQGGTNLTAIGTALQTLRVNAGATALEFADLAGDITSVVAGTGLTGGGTSSDVTLNVIGGDGITAGADEVEVTVDDSTIELSASDGTGSVRVKDAGVTYAKIQNVSATDLILGRDTAGAGSIEEITPANVRTMINVADGATAVTTENIQDVVGAMFTGNTETRIAVTYDDADGTIDLAVDDMTSDTQLTTEQVEDIIGAMVSGNTETNIAVTYDDTNGKLDFVSTDTNTQLTTEEVQDIVGAMFSGNTETRIAATYVDGDGTIDLVVDDMTTDANTTYSTSVVDSSDDAIIRLTGSDAGTDDVKLVAGGNITLTPSGDDITIASADTNTNQLTTFTVSATTDTTPTTISQGDDLMFTAGAGITCETTADGTVTIANTATDTNTNQLTTFTVSATTDTTPTTISQGDDLFFAAGSGITCETTADGTVTIAATSGGTYTAGDGLDLTGTVFSTDLKSAGGLKITSTELELDVNGLADAGTTTFGTTTFGAGDYLAVADASASNAPKKVKFPVELGMAISDETTAITVNSPGTPALTFRMPHAMTVTEVRANVNVAPTDQSLVVDINEGGTSILSTKLSIDATEKTSTTAATPAVISDSTLADDAEITVEVDQVGLTEAGKGLKIWLIGYR